MYIKRYLSNNNSLYNVVVIITLYIMFSVNFTKCCTILRCRIAAMNDIHGRDMVPALKKAFEQWINEGKFVSIY